MGLAKKYKACYLPSGPVGSPGKTSEFMFSSLYKMSESPTCCTVSGQPSPAHGPGGQLEHEFPKKPLSFIIAIVYSNQTWLTDLSSGEMFPGTTIMNRRENVTVSTSLARA